MIAREMLRRLDEAVVFIEGDAFLPFIIKESKQQSPHQRFTMTSPYHDFYLEFLGDEAITISDDDAGPEAIAEELFEGLRAGRFLVEA